ncbi:MAG: amidase [Candidatus Rokubacteria bacterium]|nr:amidase [Candidatus Rokubacteria bacterium]
MADAPLHTLSITAAAERIRTGRLTATALAQAHLSRIEAVDPAMQAWVAVDRAGALEAAVQLDAEAAAGRLRGPLHGIPVGLKDIFHVRGLKTTAGARGFADVIPAEDATSVARLRAAGAVILGKLHTTEFAFLDPAPTRNPWHRERTPGGSSSGSAAAVAARMVPAALGSQTVGSTLRPAAFCGVVGLKPTYGRVSRRGIVVASWSLDHVGIFARSVADAALLLSVLAGHDPADPGSATVPPPELGPLVAEESARPPRLGLVGEPFLARAEPEMRGHLETVARALADKGATVEPVALPALVPAVLSAVQLVVRAEAAAYHADLFRAHAAEYGPKIRAAIEAGMCIPAALYLRAQRIRRQARRELRPLLEGFDALLMPPAAGPAPDRATTGDPSFNALWSGIGAPSLALPTGLAAGGLPLGVQLIGASFAEARLLAAARWVEAAMGFAAAPPESGLVSCGSHY